MPNTKFVVAASIAWCLICLISVWVEPLEDWAHRLSSFVGFLLFTIEGILGLLGVGGKSLILAMAALHGVTFFLSVAGRYQSRVRKRPRRDMKDLAQQAMTQMQSESTD